MVPPSKIFKHSLSQHLRTGLDNTDRQSAGSQNDENMPVLSQGHSRSNEGGLKSNDAQDDGDKMTEGLLVIAEGHPRSHRASEHVNGGQSVTQVEGEGEGRSRSVITRCVECGCERITNIASMTTNVYTSNQRSSAELHQTRGSAATRQSRCGGQNTAAQGTVGTCQPRSARGHSVVQGKVGSFESSHGAENHVSQGRVVTDESRCGGQMIDVQSYSGVISRELSQQLVQLLNELDTARHHNIHV